MDVERQMVALRNQCIALSWGLGVLAAAHVAVLVLSVLP